MKKLLLVSLLVLGIFSLAACVEPVDEEPDTEAPVITEASDAVLEYAQGSTAPDWASLVEVSDNVDESIDVVVDASEANMNQAGTFDIYFNATDEAGNEATELALTITIVDETDPVIELVPNVPVTFVYGSSEPDWSAYATATDNNDGELEITVNDALVDMNTLGSFFVQFVAVDAAGNQASLSLEIFIVDRNDPVIELNEDAQVVYFPGDAEPDWASLVTVSDNVDDDLAVTVDASAADMSVPNTFDVTYTVTDNQGNEAVPLVVTITVTNAVEYAYDYEDGVFDNPDGYGWQIQVDPDDAENHIIGRPMEELNKGGRMSFADTDVAGLDFELTLDMVVYDMTQEPAIVIALDAVRPYVDFNNNTFIRYKTAEDILQIFSIVNGNWTELVDGVPFTMVEGQWYTWRIVVSGTHVQLFVDDTLILEADMVASFYDGEIYLKNNSAFHVDNVMITTYDNSYMTDDTAPVLTASETYEFTQYEGSDPLAWEYLVNISENTQGAFTVDITGEDLVDMNTPGTYDITYVATDAAGNVSDPLVITITILEMPEINLAAGAIVEYDIDTAAPDWTTLVDLAFADDFTLNVDSSAVDMTAVGAYNVIYTLVDADGNDFLSYTLEITVIDPSATPEAIVAAAKDNLDLGDLSAIISDLTLPDSDPNTATITWASSDETVIATDGTVTRPTAGSGDATVTLTATISSGAVSDTKEFVVTVLQEDLYTTLFTDDFESYNEGVNPSDSVNYGKGIKTKLFGTNQVLNIVADGTADKIWNFNIAGYTEVVIEIDYYIDSSVTSTTVKSGFGLYTGADVLTVKPVSNRGVLYYRPSNPDFYAGDLFSDGTVTQTTLNTDEWYTWRMVLDATNVTVYVIDSGGTETMVYQVARATNFAGSDIYFGIRTERIDIYYDNLVIKTID